jgi:hypothetical protein
MQVHIFDASVGEKHFPHISSVAQTEQSALQNCETLLFSIHYAFCFQLLIGYLFSNAKQ